MKELSGKVAVVTGAAQGLGAEYALQLARRGVRVVAADARSCDDTVEAVRAEGGDAWGIRLDITDAEALAAMVREATTRWGAIDILVNNAAIAADLDMKGFLDIGQSEWRRVMDVNAGGTFECIKAVAPGMIERRSGKIVNVASTTYLKGAPRMMHYVASKGAVIGITRGAARELGAFGITVNCIAPGLTMTEPVKAKGLFSGPAYASNVAGRALPREQLPSDLVGAMLFLASSSSDFITGQTLVVDGGGVML